MTVYCQQYDHYQNSAIFWDSEEPNNPDGTVNHQTRKYPYGEAPAGSVWPPVGGIYEGKVPAPYVDPTEVSVEPSAKAQAEVAVPAPPPTETQAAPAEPQTDITAPRRRTST
jgi:hypothetical protein